MVSRRVRRDRWSSTRYLLELVQRLVHGPSLHKHTEKVHRILLHEVHATHRNCEREHGRAGSTQGLRWFTGNIVSSRRRSEETVSALLRALACAGGPGLRVYGRAHSLHQFFHVEGELADTPRPFLVARRSTMCGAWHVDSVSPVCSRPSSLLSASGTTSSRCRSPATTPRRRPNRRKSGAHVTILRPEWRNATAPRALPPSLDAYSTA